MAKHLRVSKRHPAADLAQAGLKPHRLERYMASDGSNSREVRHPGTGPARSRVAL